MLDLTQIKRVKRDRTKALKLCDKYDAKFDLVDAVEKSLKFEVESVVKEIAKATNRELLIEELIYKVI
jgi:hypothetical protein